MTVLFGKGLPSQWMNASCSSEHQKGDVPFRCESPTLHQTPLSVADLCGGEEEHQR